MGFNESKGRVDTFANRLQKAMDIRGMKKAELSRKTGISQQRIGQYVSGGYEAKQSALYVIAKTLKIDPAWLMGYDLPMEPPAAAHAHSRIHNIADDELKLALFGSTKVSDALLHDIRKMAKIHLELYKKESAGRRRNVRYSHSTSNKT